MQQIVIGVMGPAVNASSAVLDAAYELGRQSAVRGWIVLSGGRDCGVMDAVSRGAKNADGFTVGILPEDTCAGASQFLDLLIPTDLGNARNNINVLASTVVVACGMGIGTASEVALALKAQKSVVLLKSTPEAAVFFTSLDPERVFTALSVDDAIEHVEKILSTSD